MMDTVKSILGFQPKKFSIRALGPVAGGVGAAALVGASAFALMATESGNAMRKRIGTQGRKLARKLSRALH